MCIKIEVIDGDWEKNIAIDVFGSVYALVSIDRPSEIGDGAGFCNNFASPMGCG